MPTESNQLSQLSAEHHNKFCEFWPTVKEVLGFIRGLVPGDGTKKAIDEIIQWGDRAYNIGCPRTGA